MTGQLTSQQYLSANQQQSLRTMLHLADDDSLHVEPITQGGNNRVYRVITHDLQILAKVYFRSASDPRDRLNTEYAFSRFLWDNGERCIPQPLACDDSTGISLFEFVPGVRIQPGAISPDHLAQSISFITRIQRLRRLKNASLLPPASEACFCFDEHLSCIDRRIDRLAQLSETDATDAAMKRWVRAELTPAWETLRAHVLNVLDQLALNVDSVLAPGDRIISPSDFGFHNVIQEPSGQLRYVDFEYAGWDDPAKLICDFFCQPAVPAPPAQFGEFASTVCEATGNSKLHLARAKLLHPVYQVKWCCIMLNEFLPSDARRRQFARPQEDSSLARLSRLKSAQAALLAIPFVSSFE